VTEPRDFSDPPRDRVRQPDPPGETGNLDRGEANISLDALAAQAMAQEADQRAASDECDRLLQQGHADLARTAQHVAYAVTRDWALAEDAVQKAWIKVMTTGARYERERSSFKNWFLTIVQHAAMDVANSNRRHAASLGQDDTVERSTAHPLPASTAADVVDLVSDTDVLERVADALIDGAHRLSAVQRDIIARYLFDVPEMGTETAQRWAITPANARQIKRRLSDALQLTGEEREAVDLYLQHRCSWTALRGALQDDALTDALKARHGSAVSKLRAQINLSLEEEN